MAFHATLLRLRHWPTWFAVGLLWLVAQLPYRLQLSIGRQLGHVIKRCSHKTRRVTDINLALCFPELSALEREILRDKNFESVGMGIVETALTWWGNPEKLLPQVHIHGLEYVDAALQHGKGVIFCSAHFSALELSGRLFALKVPISAMYRPQKNPVLDYLARRYRYRFYRETIAREDLRGMIKSLKKNNIVWYTADIDAGTKNGIFVPFFNVPAASLTITSRLARITGARVVPAFYYRREGGGYDVHLGPILDHFPSDDLEHDTGRINQIIEAAIRQKPEQYLWQYKRFKTRPAGETRFYKI